MTAKKKASAAAKSKAPRSKSAKASPPQTKAPQSMPYDQGKWAHVYVREPGEQRFWLVKSEPDAFSFDDLMAAPRRTTSWDGVRNTGARNFLRDAMKKGDGVLYYHSNASPSAVVGTAKVVREGYPDDTAFDSKSDHFDAESDPEHPMWFMVDVQGVAKFEHPVSLSAIKANPDLSEMALIRVSRLSIVPVTRAEWDAVHAMAHAMAQEGDGD